MRRFGKLLQRLRGPDVDEYRRKLAVLYWKKNWKHKSDRKYDTGYDTGHVHYQNEEWGTYENEEEIEECEAFVKLPKKIRDYHRHATRLKIKIISLRETAKLIGINKNTLHDYEIGKRYPPAEFIFDFCEALGLSAEKLMRDWIGFHPNPNVSKHVNEGCYAVRDIWKDNNGYMDPSDADVIQFIQRAIQVADHTHQVNMHRGQVAHHVAYTAAKILHRIIVRGLPIHPNSITTREDLYTMHSSPFEIDENGNILGEKKNPEED